MNTLRGLMAYVTVTAVLIAVSLTHVAGLFAATLVWYIYTGFVVLCNGGLGDLDEITDGDEGLAFFIWLVWPISFFLRIICVTFKASVGRLIRWCWDSFLMTVQINAEHERKVVAKDLK